MKPEATEELFRAVEAQNAAWVQSCIEAGAGVNARNSRGKTPLHVAAELGAAEIVRMLVKNGGDVLAQDEDGNKPRTVAQPAKGDGMALADDSFNRMLGIKTRDDLEREHAGLLAFLKQAETAAEDRMREQERLRAESVKEKQRALKSRSRDDKFRLR